MEEIYLGGQLRSFFKLPDGFPPGQPKEEIKMAKDEFYRNFSNRASFNGQAIRADEELVPVVLSKEMAQTLKPAGLNYDNVETWTFRHGKKVPVVFSPVKRPSWRRLNRSVPTAQRTLSTFSPWMPWTGP